MLQTSAANQTTYCIIPRPTRQRRRVVSERMLSLGEVIED